MMSREHIPQADEINSAVGRRNVLKDNLDPRVAQFLAATLDLDPTQFQAGSLLPLGWHWLFFLDAPANNDVGPDGRTVASGGFLPDTGLPRRMWAGGELTCHRPLILGHAAKNEASIESIEEKQGRSGRLMFLDVRHAISHGDGLAVEERRDIVMREAAKPGQASRRVDPLEDAVWRREMTPNHLMLFRFSALTFNGHRIHYDADYVRDVEGYEDLLVHGPLLALLLLDLARRSRPDAAVRRFRYRALAPLYVDRALALCGKPSSPDSALLWVEGDDGRLATQAEVDFV